MPRTPDKRRGPGYLFTRLLTPVTSVGRVRPEPDKDLRKQADCYTSVCLLMPHLKRLGSPGLPASVPSAGLA